jgi:DNA-binding MarR family transcriptional regulator
MKPALEPHDVLVALLLVQNAMERRSENFFQDYGLTGAQFNILNLLAAADGSLDQLALTERLLVGKSSISIVLNRMAKAGLIGRREHARDRRQVVLALTPKGRALWRRISTKYEAEVREIFGSLPVARRAGFLDGLGALYAALKPGEQGGPARSLREMMEYLVIQR